MQWASELEREECDIADLWVSTKCGESDTTTGLGSCPTVGNMYDKLIPKGIYGVFGETSEITGAEHLAKARAASPEIGEKWMKVWQAYEDEVIQAHKTDDLSDSQPTKGNIAGGLTTIEEKALGNLEKIGRTCKYIDVLEPAEAPAKGPGLYYMDTSSAAAECVTLMAAAGYVVHTFPTGQGNIIGNPIIAGDQDFRQSAHRAHHVGTHRPRRLRHPAPRDDLGTGRRCADRHGPAHRQWPADRGRSARPSRVRADQALSQRLKRLMPIIDACRGRGAGRPTRSRAAARVPSNAQSVARALVAAEADGLKGHGLSRLPTYAAQAKAGKVDGFAKPRLTRPRPALHRDRCRTTALPIRRSMRRLPRCQRSRGSEGIAAAGIRRSHHCRRRWSPGRAAGGGRPGRR